MGLELGILAMGAVLGFIFVLADIMVVESIITNLRNGLKTKAITQVASLSLLFPLSALCIGSIVLLPIRLVDMISYII